MSFLSLAGFGWVILNLLQPGKMQALSACPFRAVTGIPCPACNSTHSVVKIIQLNWIGAWFDNPLGFVLTAGLFVFPVWILFDTVRAKSTFYEWYLATEQFVRRRWVAIQLIAIVVANWLWSIHKFTH